MRDTVALEEAGVPSVLIVDDVYESIGRATAKLLGYPDLRVIVIPQPKPGKVQVEQKELVGRVLREVESNLGQ